MNIKCIKDAYLHSEDNRKDAEMLCALQILSSHYYVRLFILSVKAEIYCRRKLVTRERNPYARCKFRLSEHNIIDGALSLKGLKEKEAEKGQNIPASVPCVWVDNCQRPSLPFTVL